MHTMTEYIKWADAVLFRQNFQSMNNKYYDHLRLFIRIRKRTLI